MTRRTPNLELVPDERIDVHPDDAARLGLSDGDRVQITSRRGSLVARAHATDQVSPGQVFIGFHFPDAPANVLTSSQVDEVTSCPEYKVTAVALRRSP